MRQTFVGSDKPLITAMIRCKTPEKYIEKIGLSLADGAEAIGVQLEWLECGYRTRSDLENIFSACCGLPVYVTAYRHGESQGLPDEALSALLMLARSSGATMLDVMGDVFFRNTQYGMNVIPVDVARQLELVDSLHEMGGEVMMSACVKGTLKVVEYEMIAADQGTRRADIIGIFNNGVTRGELSNYRKSVERISEMTEKKLQIEIAGEGITFDDMASHPRLCMYRCVQSHGEFDSPDMPLLKKAIAIRDSIYKSKV